MNSAPVLVLDPAGADDTIVGQVLRAVARAGGEPRRVADAERIGTDPVVPEPLVAVLGPNLPQPLLAARQLHRACPGVHLVFVAHAPDEPGLQRRLLYGAPPDSRWTLLRADDARMTDALAEAIGAARQARQLRTTLDRMNLRLAARPAPEAADLRRLVVSDRYLATILNHAQEAIAALDARGIVQSWNRGAERLLGLPAAQACGRPLAALAPWPPELAEAVTLAAGGEVVRRAWELALPARVVQIELVLSPVHDGATLVGVAAILHDVTALHQLVESLRETDRRKDEFLAMLAHELRNPLAPVLNATRVLARGERLSEGGQAALAMIERQVRQMKHLVDDLLEVARITRGQIRLDVAPLSVAQAIRDAVETARPAFDAKRQRLQAPAPDAGLRVVADRVRLAQILENLLSNASKYTPVGGNIRVAAQGTDDVVEITVADDGIGIAPEQLESVFGLFVQAQPGVGEHQGGLGIGLALVRRLVELHGGTVHAASAGRGQGATFTLRLPGLAPAQD